MSLKSNALRFQFAIFFSKEIDRPDRVFWDLEDEFDVFDTIPVIQPLPAGIEIDDYPVIKFSSSNKVFSCAIAKGRLDLFIEHGHQFGNYSYSSLLSEYSKLASKLIDFVITQTKIKIVRLGFVSDYIYFSNNPSDLIETKQLTSHISGTTELNIRRNVPKTYSSVLCNDITSINSGGIILNNNPFSGVIIQRDINNKGTLEVGDISEVANSLLHIAIGKFTEDKMREVLGV